MPNSTLQPHRRFAFTAGIQLRSVEGSDETSREIEGYAIRFGERSVDQCPWDPDFEYYEYIDAEAVTRELLEASDIILTLFHDRKLVLGRSRPDGSGSMSYELTPEGVKFRCTLPETTDGDKALELIRRGDITGCSFAFTIDWRDNDAYTSVTEERDGKTVSTVHVRKISQIQDFSLVMTPAYETTSVNLREIINTISNMPIPTPTPAQAAASIDAQAATIEQNAAAEERGAASIPAAQISQVEQQRAVLRAVAPALTAPASAFDALATQIREAVAGGGRRVEINLRAVDNTMDTSLVPTEARPVQTGSFIEALNSQTIYDTVGIQVLYGLKGRYQWPVAGRAKVSVVGEKKAVLPQTIDITGVVARPERLSAVIYETWEAENITGDSLRQMILNALYEGARQAIDKILLTPEKVEGAATLSGPLVKAKKIKGALNSADPNALFQSLASLKGKLYAEGVDIRRAAWVVSPEIISLLQLLHQHAES